MKSCGFNSLLTMGYQNAKLAKSDASGLGYLSAIMYLAPSSTSGVNVCPQASPGCIASCLFTAGRGRFNNVQHARTQRTKYYFSNRKEFIKMLYDEIAKFAAKTEKAKLKPAIRLNGTSDLGFHTVEPGLFTTFPNVQFYDYTKVVKRMLNFTDGKLPDNYHLTFSRSELNERDCETVAKAGGNVAVVFEDKNYPKEFFNLPVYNADLHDLRFLDPNGVGGLYAKGKAKKDTTGFVVPTVKVKKGRKS